MSSKAQHGRLLPTRYDHLLAGRSDTPVIAAVDRDLTFPDTDAQLPVVHFGHELRSHMRDLAEFGCHNEVS